MNSPSMDVQGQAILDHYKGVQKGPLLINNTYGDPEEMPVEVFFREEDDLTTLEHLALIECTGNILDVGAGAGALTLILQARGSEVAALEPSAGCCEVMSQSGVRVVIQSKIENIATRYDTLLIMMNGTGLAGSLSKLTSFLKLCKARLKPKGQILIDSSDISYLYEDTEKPVTGYYGDLRYQFVYNQRKSEWFDWLYVDQETLTRHAEKAGLSTEILHTDENDQYLACLTAK